MENRETIDLNRKRSQFAYGEAFNWSPQWRERAVAKVKGLPVALRAQGLAVTMASLICSEEAHQERIALSLAKWLLEESPIKSLVVFNSGTGSDTLPRRLLKACIDADRPAYQAAQTEALAFLDRLKLFAEALHGNNR